MFQMMNKLLVTKFLPILIIFLTIFLAFFLLYSLGFPLVNKLRFRLMITLDFNFLAFFGALMSEFHLRHSQLDYISIERLFWGLGKFHWDFSGSTSLTKVYFLRAMTAKNRFLARFAVENGGNRDRITETTSPNDIDRFFPFDNFFVIKVDVDFWFRE